MNARGTGGFTLLELLAVVGLSVGVFAVGLMGLRRSATGTAREAAVALLAARVVEARSLALGRGEAVRLLVHADPAQPDRYLRFLVLAVPTESGWRASDSGSPLPDGWVVLPPVGLELIGPGAVRRAEDDWDRPSGGALRSTALRSDQALGEGEPILGTAQWLVVHFSPTGGVFAGDLVVARGRADSLGAPVTVECTAPESVAGVSLSSYGVPTFVRDRAAF